MLPKVFHIDIPVELSKEILACKSPEAVEQVGTNGCCINRGN